jgi:type I restriction enzyme S subunit
MSSPSINMATDHPSVQKLASVVKVVRDRLRKVGITDMDSMMHNVLFVAARMLDDATIKKLGIPPPLLWTNLIKKVNEKDNEGADKQFKNILDILDAKFGMKRFPYMLESMDDFVSIMKSYDDVDIHEAAKHTDVLGYIYEQHLSTGSGSGRDLGKFYTDRQITHYLTELLGSDVSSLGRPDSMCDATMGTGGFILSYIDLVHAKHPDIKWELMDLAGGDIDDKVAAIARLNVFLRTGKIFPMIRQRNTLKNDICDPAQPSERRTFNRLLMNIPFGVKGLTLADDCCPRVKEIVKAGTKSEPLFMALVCQLLAEGGKAAVIVPDGVLMNCSKQHDAMRKYLLDNFKVLRIIKMRGKFFMNTGIQPSVIVFERSGKTEEVEFWDVEKVASGELVEKCEMKVGREKFDASCSFDMRRYQEVKAVVNPAGYETLKLGDLFEVKGGKAISKVNLTGTLYPYYGCNGINGHVDEFLFDGEYIVCAQDGSIGSVYLLNEKFYPSNHTHILKTKDTTKITNAYGAYFLKMNVDWKSLTTSLIPKVTQGNLLEIKIIVPPLETQEEIVQALDLIYNNATTAKASATSTKAQMAAVMRSVGARGYEKKKLGDVFNVKGGKAINKENLTGTKFPYYGCNGVNGYVDEYLFDGEYIICAQDGSIGSVYIVNEKFYPSNHTHIITTKDSVVLNNKFASYYLKMCVDWKPLVTSIIPKVTQGKLLEILMVIPPLPIQQEVLAILNEMEAELKVMEQMAANAEQRAKYILDGYLTAS